MDKKMMDAIAASAVIVAPVFSQLTYLDTVNEQRATT